MLKVLTVFGTRPEAIKLTPVIRELQRCSMDSQLHTITCVTAQHRDMPDQVLNLFDSIRDRDLDVMKDNQTPTQVAATVWARTNTRRTPTTAMVRLQGGRGCSLFFSPFRRWMGTGGLQGDCRRSLPGMTNATAV